MKGNQSGFTLIEILISVAIMAVITTVIAVALANVMSVTWGSSKRMDVIKQVENALYYINRDGQAANNISTSTSGYWLVFNRSDGTSISYRITTSGDQTYLERTQGSTTTTIAKYIDSNSGHTFCSYAANVLSVQITVSEGGFRSATETRTLKVYPRLNQSIQ
jgi:prepilin-type N-terminal cleavage/methylation domain-containing protein